MAFEEQARSRGLSEQTIGALMEEEYTSAETLLTLREEDLSLMKIKLAQRGLLRKWLDELKASTTGVTTATATVRGSTGPRQGSVHGASEVNVPMDVTKSSMDATVTVLQSQRSEAANTIAEVKQDSSVLPSASDFTRGLDDETTREVEAYIRQHGVQNVGQFLNNKLKRYKDMKINIAITGQSGSGKSSFINCIRNLTADENGAAQVGVKETTMEIQPYPDPQNENLIFWDLPGVGTPNFPRESYLEKVEIDKYDFFLILTSTRFTENDLYLARQVHRRGKQFAFLRTKIDSDLANDKDDHPRTHDPKQMLAHVEQDCIRNLEMAKLPTDSVFVISSNLTKRTKFDFPRLMEAIVKEAPDAKKTSLILSLTACSEKGIEAKRRELSRRIPSVATNAVTCETHFGTQEDVIKDEIQLYVEQFGLTREHLDKMGVDLKTLSREAAKMVGGVWANMGVSIMRGISTLFSMPANLVKGFTGQLDKEKEEIASRLNQTLNRCAETAKEIIKQGHED